MDIFTIQLLIIKYWDWAMALAAVGWWIRTRSQHKLYLRSLLETLLGDLERVRARPDDLALRRDLYRQYSLIWAAKDRYVNWIDLSQLQQRLHRIVVCDAQDLDAHINYCYLDVYAVFNRLSVLWPLNVVYYKYLANTSLWIKYKYAIIITVIFCCAVVWLFHYSQFDPFILGR